MEDRSMTGTPLDLTPFGGIVKGIGLLYWIAALGGAGLALWWFKRWWLKLSVAAAILAMFIVPAAQRAMQRQEQYNAAKATLDAAKAHFEMRCKSAGEKITRTVDNVEGIALLRLRPRVFDDANQFTKDDPYGRSCGAEDCVASYLVDERMVDSGGGSFSPSNRAVYRFVEADDPSTGQRQRYRKSSSQAPLEKQPAPESKARYGVTWEDVSTQEDRQYWIAGGSIKVVDLQTNEVIAERIGFLLDSGQGSTAAFRSPWNWARSRGNACPPRQGHNLAFVEQVLKPIK
jgi:hypothetical protein